MPLFLKSDQASILFTGNKKAALPRGNAADCRMNHLPTGEFVSGCFSDHSFNAFSTSTP